MMDPAALSRFLAPLQRRVMLVVGRAVLQAAAAGGTRLQVTLLADETRDDVDRLQDYGLASAPVAGAEAVVLSVGGCRDHPVAVVVSDGRGRPDLAGGEVALHTTRGDQWVLLKADGSIVLHSATKVVAHAPLVEVPNGDVVAQGVSLRNHTHSGAGAPPAGGGA